MSATRRKRIEERMGRLESERQNWLTHWRELARNFRPYTGKALYNEKKKQGPVKRFNSPVNNIGFRAQRTLGSGMMAGITSPARPWFKLGVPDPGLMEFWAVKSWLAEVERIMRAVLSQSNFYTVMHNLYSNMGIYGLDAMYIREHPDRIIHSVQFPLGSYTLAEGDDGMVNASYRRIEMTVGQLVESFGLNSVSQRVKHSFEKGNLELGVKVVHAIEPNDGRDPKSPFADNMPISSIWFEQAEGRDKLLLHSGFHEKSLIAPRWDTDEDVYGFGPGSIALGDNRALQLEEKRKMEAIDKMVRPPLVGPVGLKNVMVDLQPGGMTYLDTIQGSQKLESVYSVDPRITDLKEDILINQDRIDKAFYVDLFMMLANSDRRQITAREIDERHEEKLLMLGPVLERFNHECLDPAIDRVFAICERRGLFPEPPRQLQDVNLRVEYVSVLAQAQRMVGLGAIERFVGFVGQVSQVNPDAVDKLDADKAVEDYADMVGVSPKVVKSENDVAEVREVRAQQAQAQRMMEQAGGMASGAKQLSEIDTDDSSNALSDLRRAVTGV